MTDSRMYAELVQVERAALRRGPRMRGLGDAARVGDYATPAQWHSANSWWNVPPGSVPSVVYVTMIEDHRFSYRATAAQDGSEIGAGTVTIPDGRTLTKPSIGFHPRVPGSSSSGTAPVPGPASAVAPGGVSMPLAYAFGAVAIAVVGAGVWWVTR